MRSFFNKNHWVALYTIGRKETLRLVRIWPQAILPPIITNTLYFIIFGKVIGTHLSHITLGYDYITYITPGIILMGVITGSYIHTSSGVFSQKFMHSIEDVLMAPIPNWVIIMGFVLSGTVRGILLCTIITIIATLFYSLHIYSWILMIFTVLNTAFIFSFAGFINGIFAKKFDDVNIIPTFLLTPLTYLGGVFFSIEMLPDPWKNLAYLNPIFYEIYAFRHSILGFSDHPALWGVYAVLPILNIILFSICLVLLKKGAGLKK